MSGFLRGGSSGAPDYSASPSTTDDVEKTVVTIPCGTQTGLEVIAEALIRSTNSDGDDPKTFVIKKASLFSRGTGTVVQNGISADIGYTNGLTNAYTMTVTPSGSNILVKIKGTTDPANWDVSVKVNKVNFIAPPAAPGIPYPDVSHLRAHFNFTRSGRMFSDVAATTIATVGGRIRAIKGITGAGDFITATNTTSDASSPYKRVEGGSFGETENSFLDTGINQVNPYTVYTYCERSATSCLIVSNSDSEVSTWLNSLGNNLIVSQGSGYSGTGAVDNTAGFAVRGAVFNGPNSVVFADASEATSAATVAAPWTVRIGCMNTSFKYTGKIKHVFIYDGAHTLSQRNAVRAFIASVVAGSNISEPVYIPPAPVEIELGIGVHYEGGGVYEANTEFDPMRTKHPGLKFTHFFNPNSWLVQDPQLVTNGYNQQMRTGDEAAMHIHPWAVYTTAAGVTSRVVPNFNSETVSNDTNGYAVCLTAYPYTDFRKMVKFGLDQFVAHGFTRPKTFVAGGWLMDAERWQALRAEGILTDCSRVNIDITRGIFNGQAYYYLQQQIEINFAGTGSLSQPTDIVTPDGTLRSVPSNGAAAEYAATANIYQVYLDNFNAKRADPTTRRMIFMSCHINAAGPLDTVIDMIHAHAAANGVTIKYVTATEAGNP